MKKDNKGRGLIVRMSLHGQLMMYDLLGALKGPKTAHFGYFFDLC